MPLDLDEMFDALGRQADTVPLSGAGGARRRGRERNRAKAVVSAAAAVVLVAVGAGVAMRNPDKEALPAVVGTPMPQVGETIDLGGPTSTSFMTTDGERAYVVWVNPDDKGTQVKAADLESGVTAWEAQPVVDPLRTIEQLIVVPSALLVITRSHDPAAPGVGLHAFDPLPGVPSWSRDVAEADSLVFTTDMLVQVTRATGKADGFDWASGDKRWSRTDGPPVIRAIGMAIPDDDVKANWSGSPVTNSDGRVVLLTANSAEVRTAATGALQRTVPLAGKPGPVLVAHDGWIFTHDGPGVAGPHRIRATDLTGTSATYEQSIDTGGQVMDMRACGTGRVCVLTEKPASFEVTAIDARERRVLWRRDGIITGASVSSAGGATLVINGNSGMELLDAEGRLIISSPERGHWVDNQTLVLPAPDNSGRLARLSTTDGKMTVYDRNVGDFAGTCTSTSTRLACAGRTGGLRVWRVG